MEKILIKAKKIYRKNEDSKAVCKALEEIFGDEIKGSVFDPDSVEWVDLGLPSGRLWAKENAEGYYNFDDAVDTFGDYLPKGAAFAELIEECRVEWNSSKKGLDITGPNGNKIFLPALGYRSTSGSVSDVEESGRYWSRMPYVPNSKSFAPYSQTNARYLYFSSGGVYPLNSDYRASRFSVRPARELS